MLVAALGADLIQYSYAALAWRWFHDRNERKLEDPLSDPELLAPRWMNVPTNSLFISKVGAVIVAYVVLLVHVVGKIAVVT